MPCQPKQPQITHMSQKEKQLIHVEVNEMLSKGAIHVAAEGHTPGGFLSNLFLVGKKDGGYRPVINLKHLNSFIPYQHFKMEKFKLPTGHFEGGRFHVQIRHERCLFFNNDYTLPRGSTFVFLWSGNLYEFLCLCFGLGPAPRIFTKLLKIPISILRRINIRMIIYLDDMLLLGQTMEETIMSRDTVIFLLQLLGFVDLNLKKSIMTPTQKIEFLGLTVDSVIMALSSPNEKIQGIQEQCARVVQETEGVLTGIEKTNRFVNFCHSGSASSTNTMSLSSETNK